MNKPVAIYNSSKLIYHITKLGLRPFHKFHTNMGFDRNIARMFQDFRMKDPPPIYERHIPLSMICYVAPPPRRPEQTHSTKLKPASKQARS